MPRSLDKKRKWQKQNYAGLTPIQKRQRQVSRYGITAERYEEILSRQGGVCAICKQLPEGTNSFTKSLHVDHDHDTKRVRGLLCWRCNSSLEWWFLVNTERLENALRYIGAIGD